MAVLTRVPPLASARSRSLSRLPRRAAGVLAVAVAAVLLAPAAALAHDERDPVYPDGSGSVPAYRVTPGPRLLVCKTDANDFAGRISSFPDELRERNLALFAECQRTGYRHLQEAVDAAVLPGTTILMLPGLYQEEPSLAPVSSTCASLPRETSAAAGYQVLTFQDQLACRHNQNLVAVLGKQDLQIEGTGVRPGDVVLDAQYQKLNGLRADRANGLYLRNFTAQRATFNAIYVLETDGFVIDRMLGRWNDEYGFLAFASDHGLFTDCEGYGNGDSAIYPGAAQNVNRDRGHRVLRYAIEIRRCYAHHNLLGYSGTAGDSVWAHDNRFTENGVGVATDSAFPDHPGLPQNHAKFERNIIGDNNQDYYRYVRDGTCAKPYAERGYERGVVCPAVGAASGTGVLNPGGNYNIWRDNWIYGHDYAGFVTAWVPGFVRGENSFQAQFDTSHHNRYFDNRMGVRPDGERAPNGMDFWWDGQGRGSCWQAPRDGAEPMVLPACDGAGFPAGFGVNRAVSEPGKTLKLYVCANYSQREQRIAVNCDWFGATGLQRIEVQYALGEALLLGIVLIALWLRRLLRSRFALGALLVALAGLGVGVFGTADETTPLTPIGLALTGVGLVAFGLALRSPVGRDAGARPALAWLTVAIGAMALLGAVDRGLVMLPWTPVGPVWVRILLELIWVPWVVLSMVRRRRRVSALDDEDSVVTAPAPVAG